MAATIKKIDKLVGVKYVGEEQNAVPKSEVEANEGVQRKRGRKVNTATATKSPEKNNKPGDRPKQAVTTKETEEDMFDVQIVVDTPDREGNGTLEAVNNKEGTKENGGNLFKVELTLCHQCVPCMKKWHPKMTEEMFAECCSVCQGNCNCSHCLHNVCPKSCIKVALDSVSPENVGDCIRLTEDFRLLPHNHRSKEDKLEMKKIALYAVKAAIKDLEKFVPKNSQYLENSQNHPNPGDHENSQVFSDLYEVPITENLQISLNTEKDVRLQIDPEYEVGNQASIKRSRTSEEGDYIPHSNPETLNKGGSAVHHATCKESSHSCSSLDNFVAELHEMRVTRNNEVEIMKKRLDFDQKREERKTKKMYHMHLNTLLAKEHLLPEDEAVKRDLLAMLYGK